jgi:hypothetical protein
MSTHGPRRGSQDHSTSASNMVRRNRRARDPEDDEDDPVTPEEIEEIELEAVVWFLRQYMSVKALR